MNVRVGLILVVALLLLIGSIVSFSCKQQQAPPEVTAPTESAELPVLAQNTLHLTNRAKPLSKPDFGFQETDEEAMEEADKAAGTEEEVSGD